MIIFFSFLIYAIVKHQILFYRFYIQKLYEVQQICGLLSGLLMIPGNILILYSWLNVL